MVVRTYADSWFEWIGSIHELDIRSIRQKLFAMDVDFATSQISSMLFKHFLRQMANLKWNANQRDSVHATGRVRNFPHQGLKPTTPEFRVWYSANWSTWYGICLSVVIRPLADMREATLSETSAEIVATSALTLLKQDWQRSYTMRASPLLLVTVLAQWCQGWLQSKGFVLAFIWLCAINRPCCPLAMSCDSKRNIHSIRLLSLQRDVALTCRIWSYSNTEPGLLLLKQKAKFLAAPRWSSNRWIQGTIFKHGAWMLLLRMGTRGRFAGGVASRQGRAR